jgi:hypothetical protein
VARDPVDGSLRAVLHLLDLDQSGEGMIHRSGKRCLRKGQTRLAGDAPRSLRKPVPKGGQHSLLDEKCPKLFVPDEIKARHVGTFRRCFDGGHALFPHRGMAATPAGREALSQDAKAFCSWSPLGCGERSMG